MIRKHTLTDKDGTALTGLFQHAEKIATGATQATRSQSITLADSAFTADKVSFVGDKGDAVSGSFETLLHEVGHAQESQAQRDAAFAEAQAVGVLNDKQNALNTAITADDTARNDTRTALNTVAPKLAKYSKPDQTAGRAYISAVNAVTPRLDAFSETGNSANETAVQTVITKRDAEQTKLKKAQSSHPALSDFADLQAKQDAWFAAAKVRSSAQAAKDAASATRDTKKKEKDATQNSKGQSKHLTNFVDFVTKNNIQPITDYARDNWPGNPEEFYAEAFSLWLNDPTYLKTNAPKLFDWFDTGQHRV